MDSIDDTSLPVNERRRAIYQRAVAKHRARGTPIDDDPLFVTLISQWIDGKIEMPDIAEQLSSRARKSPIAVSMSGSGDDNNMSGDELLSVLQRIIGLHDISTA